METVIGQLTFQMLRIPLRICIARVPKFVVACCVVHNIGLHLRDHYDSIAEEQADITFCYMFMLKKPVVFKRPKGSENYRREI